MVIVVENLLMLYLMNKKNQIEDLYVTKYFDCTYTQFTEFLAERENISISIDEVRCILKERFILSPKSHKKTRKNIKKLLLQQKKNATSKKEIAKIQANIVATEDAHPRQPRCFYFGDEVQIDASEHLWFGNVKTFLHAAIMILLVKLLLLILIIKKHLTVITISFIKF